MLELLPEVPVDELVLDAGPMVASVRMNLSLLDEALLLEDALPDVPVLPIDPDLSPVLRQPVSVTVLLLLSDIELCALLLVCSLVGL